MHIDLDTTIHNTRVWLIATLKRASLFHSGLVLLALGAVRFALPRDKRACNITSDSTSVMLYWAIQRRLFFSFNTTFVPHFENVQNLGPTERIDTLCKQRALYRKQGIPSRTLWMHGKKDHFTPKLIRKGMKLPFKDVKAWVEDQEVDQVHRQKRRLSTQQVIAWHPRVIFPSYRESQSLGCSHHSSANK